MNLHGQGEATVDTVGPTSLAGRHVLVIDDEPDFAASLQSLLELEYCNVRLAADVSAIEALPSDFGAEVILLDVRLKQTNGIDHMRPLHERWPDARVIIITGFASKSTAIAALKNGAFDYLEKPINADELHATIVRALWALDADLKVRDTQKRMRTSLEEAEAASRSKSVFLANMSHELRTPLNAIIGFSEVIKDERLGTLSPPVYMSYVENIHESGHNVLTIVNDVLDLSQIELNAKTLEEGAISLAELVDDVCCLLKEAAKSGEITLHRTLPPDLPKLRADRRMVKQMLINLLVNAIKFTPAGGRAGIHLSRDAEGALFIEVGDNGIGIDVDKLEEIMEPFAVAEPVESRKHGGVGLGLAITKRLIEHHGGRIELQSQKGVGTIVTLVVPAARLD